MARDDECGADGGMRIGRGNQSTETTSPVPLSPPQMPHDMTWNQTWATLVGSQLTQKSLIYKHTLQK
jgi:hypothetical protein